MSVLHMPSTVVFQPCSNAILLIRMSRTCAPGKNIQKRSGYYHTRLWPPAHCKNTAAVGDPNAAPGAFTDCWQPMPIAGTVAALCR